MAVNTRGLSEKVLSEVSGRRPADPLALGMALLFGVLALAEALTFQGALQMVERAPARATAVAVAEARAAGVPDVPRLTENPIFQAQPGVRSHARGEYRPEVYLQVTQPFLTSKLGAKRRAALASEQGVDEAYTGGLTRQLRHAVAAAWLTRWAAQQAVLFAADERTVATDFRVRLARGAALGEVTAVDMAAANTWLAEARLSELTAEGDATSAGFALSRLLGQRGQETAAEGEVPQLELATDLQARIPEVDAMPEVIAARAAVHAAAARVTELDASKRTRVAVGALGWREGGGDLAAVATLEVSPAWIERGQRDTASARAELVRAEGREHELRNAAENDRAVLLHELEHSGRVLEVARDEVLASAEILAAAQAARVAELEGTAQDLVIARRALFRARIDAARALSAHVLARFAVLEAFGGVR